MLVGYYFFFQKYVEHTWNKNIKLQTSQYKFSLASNILFGVKDFDRNNFKKNYFK